MTKIIKIRISGEVLVFSRLIKRGFFMLWATDLDMDKVKIRAPGTFTAYYRTRRAAPLFARNCIYKSPYRPHMARCAQKSACFMHSVTTGTVCCPICASGFDSLYIKINITLGKAGVATSPDMLSANFTRNDFSPLLAQVEYTIITLSTNDGSGHHFAHFLLPQGRHIAKS